MLQTVSDQSGKPNSNTNMYDMVAFFVLYLVIFGLLFGGHVSFKPPNSAFKSTTTTTGKSAMLKCVSGVHRQSTQMVGKSFVHDEMRPSAIKFHSRDQTSQGQQPAQVPFTQWSPTKADYLHYLVDSLAVYGELEPAVANHMDLRSIRVPGLERANALRADIQWMCRFDPKLKVPAVGTPGLAYTAYIKKLLEVNDVPGLVCHYYNTYFALSAGGLRIGQHLANKLLGGKKLQFYTFDPPVENNPPGTYNVDILSTRSGGANSAASVTSLNGGVEQSAHSDQDHTLQEAQSSATGENLYLVNLKDAFRDKIDALAARWTPAQRLHCCAETERCFEFNKDLLGYLHGG